MKLGITFILLFCTILYGCSQTAPKCDSKEAKGEVMEVVCGQFLLSPYSFFSSDDGPNDDPKLLDACIKSKFFSVDPSSTYYKMEPVSLEISIGAIRATDISTGKYSCAANIIMKAEGGQQGAIPITYTSEKTDDGYYVQVFGSPLTIINGITGFLASALSVK
jgi:hypothetical protein